MFPETVETDSLVLHPLPEVGVFDLYDLLSADSGGEEVFECVPGEPYASPGEARDSLREAEAEWDDGDGAKYGVYRAGESLAGMAGVSVDWDRRTGALGVILAEPYWGCGYAGECAMALTELAFDRLDLELVALSYDGENDRSKRAIEKFVDRVGGQYDGVLRNWTPLGDEVVDSHRYTVTREQYRRSVGDR